MNHGPCFSRGQLSSRGRFAAEVWGPQLRRLPADGAGTQGEGAAHEAGAAPLFGGWRKWKTQEKWAEEMSDLSWFMVVFDDFW